MKGLITGESVRNAIAYNMSEEFKTITEDVTKYPTIYKEKIVQDMKLPCFFITPTNSEIEQIKGNKYSLLYQMEIRYHPEVSTIENEDISAVALRLAKCLSSINLPYKESLNESDTKPVRGRDSSYKTTSGVLVYLVDYKLITTLLEDQIPTIQSLINNTDLKEE